MRRAAASAATIPPSAVTESGCGDRATKLCLGGLESAAPVVDAVTSDGVQDFAIRFVPVGNALVLDLSGVDFLAARGISVLIAVDDACRLAEAPWSLVPSRVVSRVLRLTGCDTLLPHGELGPRGTAAGHRVDPGAPPGRAGEPRRRSAMQGNRSDARPGRYEVRTPGIPTPEPQNGITVNFSLAPESPTSLRPPVFTLGSALRWLGHACPDHRRCFAPIDTRRASVWFIRGGRRCRPCAPRKRGCLSTPSRSAMPWHRSETASPIQGSMISLCRSRRDAIEVRGEPRCVRDRPEPPVPRRVPVSLDQLPAHPFDVRPQRRRPPLRPRQPMVIEGSNPEVHSSIPHRPDRRHGGRDRGPGRESSRRSIPPQ